MPIQALKRAGRELALIFFGTRISLRIMPAQTIIKSVVELVRSLPGYPRLSILDISCGDAVILEHLMRDGCHVEGTHYCDDDYIRSKDRVIPSGITLHTGIDLSQPLPFPDDAYDVVLITEVIEHLDAHIGLVHELGRILKPGGHLVLSTPNLHRLSSRWQFFWTGCHGICQRRTGWDIPRDRLYAYHIHIPDLPLLHTLIHQAGLRVKGLHFTRVEPQQFFWMLFYPLIYLATRIQIRGRSKYSAARNAGERSLFRWMTHPAALMSKQLLLLAQKDAR